MRTRACYLAALLLATSAGAQQSSDNGSVSLSAVVSGYVDIAAGGPATLTGSLGGSVTGITNKGDRLSGVSISLGDISPLNPSAFVVARIPLRLRSNIPYSLSVVATSFAAGDPMAVQPSDVGFGIGPVRRSDTGVNVSGTDSPVTSVVGDPSADPDADPGTGRWDFGAQKNLAYYSTGRTILTGQRIMQVVPASLVGGLLVDSYYAIKPQFFTPGTFSTTVTYTIATP